MKLPGAAYESEARRFLFYRFDSVGLYCSTSAKLSQEAPALDIGIRQISDTANRSGQNQD